MPSKTILQVATTPNFQESKLVLNETTAYTTTRDIQLNELPYDTTLYARVKHVDDATGTSPWGPRVTFKVRNPAAIVGICLDTSTSPGTWTWIDGSGAYLSHFDYTSHPTYVNSSMITLGENAAACKMTKIPKFYIRTAPLGITGTYSEGKKCWWISNIPTPNFRVHPAFRSSATEEVDYIAIATYLAHAVTINDIVTLSSDEGQATTSYESYNTLTSYVAARGTGWRLMNIYHVSALRFLALLAMGHANTESYYGTNYTTNYDPLSGSSNSKLLLQGTTTSKVFVDDLWAMRNCIVDYLFCTDTAGTLDLREPYNHGAASVVFATGDTSRYRITPDVTASTYFNDVLDCPFLLGGVTHDLMELFLAKPSAYTAEATAAFPDTCQVTTTSDDPPYVCTVGDSWNHAGHGAGLFHTSFRWGKTYSYRYNGTRITYQPFH